MNRRKFNKTTSLATIAALAPLNHAFANANNRRKFKLCINPGIIGVSANQQELLDMAIGHGYEAIISYPQELSSYTDKELALFSKKRKKNNISWGSTNLPLEFRLDKAIFQTGLADLPKHAAALQRAGANRMNTWIMPMHPTLSYTANMKRQTERLRQCASILADYDIKLGLEYVSQKTTIVKQRFPFIRTIGEITELIENIDASNIGYVLDAIHWYCAEDTADDIIALNPSDIVTVDLNDGKAGLT